MDSLKCFWCDKGDDTVTVIENPWNDCEEFLQCDTCYENQSETAHERQSGWNEE